MELGAIVTGLIALVVLGLMLMLPKGITTIVQENITKLTPDYIKLENYDIRLNYQPLSDNKFLYSIFLSPIISYSGKIEHDTSIISFIEFKSKSQKMIVVEGLKSDDNPVIPKATKKFDGTLKAEIQSEIPPIFDWVYQKNLNKPLIEGQSIIIDKKFIVTLFDLDETLFDKLNPLRSRCAVKFLIECKNEVKTLSLRDDDNEQEKDVELCGANIKINLKETNDCKSADVDIIYTKLGEIPDFDIKEKLWLSLWRNTDCVRLWHTYEDLFEHCFGDLLGRYKLYHNLLIPK
ncbi:MAG: hypothetical protein QXD48_01040 [Candidatus Aenigmatarchaeota archaeon]